MQKFLLGSSAMFAITDSVDSIKAAICLVYRGVFAWLSQAKNEAQSSSCAHHLLQAFGAVARSEAYEHTDRIPCFNAILCEKHSISERWHPDGSESWIRFRVAALPAKPTR